MEQLHKLEKIIVDAAHQEYLNLYANRTDNRRFRFNNLEDAEAYWQKEVDLVSAHPEMMPIVRDGLCHEVVMQFTHYLTDDVSQSSYILLLAAITLKLPYNIQIYIIIQISSWYSVIICSDGN